MDEEDLAKIASLSEAQCAEMRVSLNPHIDPKFYDAKTELSN